jgi:hypothetical protein
MYHTVKIKEEDILLDVNGSAVRLCHGISVRYNRGFRSRINLRILYVLMREFLPKFDNIFVA